MEKYFGQDTPKLGFGMMRLPWKGLGFDQEQIEQMVDLFLDSGFTYFDTAYVYPGSEGIVKKTLVDRRPRESFTLADKLHARAAFSEKGAQNEFYTSLERTGAGYFDYYLLHSMMESNYRKYDRLHVWQFVNEQKEKGRIRHLGFSFHGTPRLLDELLTEHPEVEFVQLQINYLDWESRRIASRENYEVARKHGKSIVIMEPVKGGKLANPPREVQDLMKGYHPGASCSSWAIRFAASLEGILTVLSGMSTLEQVRDNTSCMKDFHPLNGEEQKIIRKARRIMGNSAEIPCTACRYCVEGCPRHIPIPEIFEAENLRLGNGQLEKAKQKYAEATRGRGKASECVQCRQCEGVCPQHLEIPRLLKQCAQELE